MPNPARHAGSDPPPADSVARGCNTRKAPDVGSAQNRSAMRLLYCLTALVLAGLLATPTQAQTPDRENARTVSTTVRVLLETLRESILQASTPDLGNRLVPIAHSFDALALNTAPASADEDLARQVQDLLDSVLRLRDDLRAEGQAVTAGRLDPIIEGLRTLLDTVRDSDGWTHNDRHEARQGWRAEGGDADSAWEDEDDEARWEDDTDAERQDDRRERWRHYRSRHAFNLRIGEELFWSDGAVQQGLPVRYNRVEGLYLGLRRGPLELDAYRPTRLFGEVGYGFALENIRYSAGLDLRVTPRGAFATKVGGYYRLGTTTEDAWKADPIENALAAFFARHDFYDYYETEGWTVYSETQLGRVGRVQAGYRDEEHRALEKNATWSLFGGDPFRLNPLASEGRSRSLIGTLEVGRVRDLTGLPRGAALRADVEVGQGLGGDFDFTRVVADGRLYVPTSHQTSLSLRLRAGSAYGDDVPFQKGFTLGGVGSVRAYPQNVFYGTRMVAANAEVTVDQHGLLDDLLDDLQLFGFADAGWVNRSRDAFNMDDAFGAAGFGIGLDDRQVRLEVAWPLRDEGFGLRPTLWLRIAPPF